MAFLISRLLLQIRQWTFATFIISLFSVPASDAQDFNIRGRLHMDAFIGIHDAGDFSNGFNNRRARLGMNGTITEGWDGIVEVDFAGAGVSANDFRLRRTFDDGSHLMIGQFKVPQGLNELTSSNNIAFIERTTVSNIITDARRLGVAYSRFDDRFGFQTMLFGRAIGQRGAIQGDMPLGVALRGVYAPEVGPGTLHLGGSIVYENLMDNNSIRFSDRPEARDSKGGQALIGLTIADGVESTLKAGIEAAYISGPLWMEGEFLHVGVNMEQGSDPGFNGGHVQAGYILTGESRSYSSGRFGTITPEGGSGAWEVIARFSNMSLNDSGYTGGKQNNVTIGLNHHVSANLRFMANVIFVNVSDLPGGASDQNPVIAALRAQFNF